MGQCGLFVYRLLFDANPFSPFLAELDLIVVYALLTKEEERILTVENYALPGAFICEYKA